MLSAVMSQRDDILNADAWRARAEAAEADARAARVAVDRLAAEVRIARGWAFLHRRRLREIEQAAVSHLPHIREDRARVLLYDIAVRAHRA